MPKRRKRRLAPTLRELRYGVIASADTVSRRAGGDEGVTRYLERIPSGTVGELQVAEIGSKSQTDP